MPATSFGGFFANLSQMSPYVSWLQYLSPVRYGFEAMLWAQWPNNEKHVQTILGFDLGYGTCVWALLALSVLIRVLTLILMRSVAKKGFK